MEPRPLLCNTEAILTAALPVLQGSSTLILDCEGLQLGERGGSLSLITLRTTAPSPIRTYIIDVVNLPRTALEPVFDILRSSDVCKVLFDGRMDYSALYHGYGVELHNLLDVQLVDVASRQTRGEGQPGQFRRLQKYLRHINFHSNLEAYQQVHKLSGLNECAEEHITGATGKQSGIVLRLLAVVYLSDPCLNTSEPQSLASSAASSVLSELCKCRRRSHPRPLRQVHAAALHYSCSELSE
jgi:exonuclease 3'-5' domain-containing protein 1